eukprot:1159433-Pelagomonas_calceolata.AAC.1
MASGKVEIGAFRTYPEGYKCVHSLKQAALAGILSTDKCWDGGRRIGLMQNRSRVWRRPGEADAAFDFRAVQASTLLFF